MIRARRALVSHVRGFFDRHLAGLCNWDEAVLERGEPADKPLDGAGRPRNNPLGKFRELVTVRFSGYELSLESPEECPPLGWIEFCRDGDVLHAGPLDESTWAAIGHIIRGVEHGAEKRRA